jgi:putative DNA modification/repair radical SAM protein
MAIHDKIGVLADAAKYDASCSTSGSARKNSGNGLGNGAVGGICHAWSADGRCVSLLKVLLSNACAYDCAYCVNRRSNDVRRAAFEPDELVRLIMDFYRRNYIEGAFLSSGVLGCPDSTMERLIAVAKTLRVREHFNGYLHMKIIPGASDHLVLEAARWADRVSVNIELPSAQSLARIAPDKTPQSIFGPMRTIAAATGFEPKRLGRPDKTFLASPATTLDGATSDSLTAAPDGVPPIAATPALKSQATMPTVMEARRTRARNPGSSILPAGQTTQMVIGASPESDMNILTLAENLYLAYDVRRVYYSAFMPTGGDPRLPAIGKPPLGREHRLYQADWLFRFYGFAAGEILDDSHPFLDERLDPKSVWALRNLHLFPLELTTAGYNQILRVPGIGPTSANRILRARRGGTLRADTLSRLGVVMRRAKWFVTVSGKYLAEPEMPLGWRSRQALDNPGLLRSVLQDPGWRVEAETQPELPWAGTA